MYLNKTMRFLIAAGLSFLFLNAAHAQQKEAIALLTKSKQDGIWIRWAPTHPMYWQLGNKYGYTIERFTLKSDGDMEENSRTILTEKPIKPFSEEELLRLSGKSDEIAVLEEILYGESAQKSFSANDISSVLSRSNEIDNRFGIAMLMCDLSTEAAKAGGLFFKDKEAQPGKRYIYRVKIAYSAKDHIIEPGVNLITFTEEKPLMQIDNLKADFDDRSVSISWPTLLHRGVYSAYYIERSDDGKSFTKLTDLPYVHMSEALESESAFYVDSLEANQKTYYYRIQGISPFAEEGPYSNVVSGEGKDNLFGELVIREIKGLENKHVKLDWEFPSHLEDQIAGFLISKSSSPDGPYNDISSKVIPKDKRHFVDVTAFNNTYYILKAVDGKGSEVSRSFPYLVQFEDNTPPAVPQALDGLIDENGTASIDWQPNTDADLLGYRVFRANSLKEEFMEVTKKILSTPSFVDTVNINVLNKKIYYTIVAVDKNYNTSGYSAPLSLIKPDIIPPAQPVFVKTDLSKDTLYLEWVNSISDDVAKYELTRMEKNGSVRKLIMSWTPSSVRNTFRETALSPGNSYQYKITVFDSTGNSSEALSKVVFFENGFRKAASNIKVGTDRQNKQINIQWENGTPAEKCLIYRRKGENPLTLYQTLTGNVEAFADKNVTMNNSYEYKVQLVFGEGIKSVLSEAIKVKY